MIRLRISRAWKALLGQDRTDQKHTTQSELRESKRKFPPKNNLGNNIKIHDSVEFVGQMSSIILGDKVSISRDVTLHCYDENSRISIGRGSCIKQFTQILTYPNAKISIGENCSINPFCVLYGLGGLKIGNNVRIATHTVFIPGNHIFDDPNQLITKQGLSKKGVSIEDDVWIGANVTVLDGVTIGHGAVIAAGAVVNRNIESYTVVGGVPCKLLKRRNR